MKPTFLTLQYFASQQEFDTLYIVLAFLPKFLRFKNAVQTHYVCICTATPMKPTFLTSNESLAIVASQQDFLVPCYQIF